MDSNGSLVWANTMVSSSLPNNSGLSITIDDNDNIYTTSTAKLSTTSGAAIRKKKYQKELEDKELSGVEHVEILMVTSKC